MHFGYFVNELLKHGVVCPHKVQESLWRDVGDLFHHNLHALFSSTCPLYLKLREPRKAAPLDNGPCRFDGLVELTAIGGDEVDFIRVIIPNSTQIHSWPSPDLIENGDNFVEWVGGYSY